MVEVCGVKYVEGVGKKSQKEYKAYLIHYTEDGKSQGFQGFTTGDAFLSLEVLGGLVPHVGDKLNLFYDKNGFLKSVEFCA